MTQADQASTAQSSWERFSALEKELEESQAAFRIHQDNYHCSSDHYRSIVVQACAEIQRVYELTCGKTLEVTHSIRDHIASITDHCHDFFNTEIHMPSNEEILKPWSACIQGENPDFWKTYHDLHHIGDSVTTTLNHAIQALAGLFALLLVFE